MVPKTDECFPKDSRILKRSEYLEVQHSGRRVHVKSLLGLVLPRPGQSNPRLGITVTRKFGSAVARNRFKRLAREAFRRGVMVVPQGADMIVIPKRSAACLDPSALLEELSQLGKKAMRSRGAAK